MLLRGWSRNLSFREQIYLLVIATILLRKALKKEFGTSSDSKTILLPRVSI